jgi:dienelactone hydrolase
MPALAQTEITPKEAVVISGVGRGGRVAIHTDAVEAKIVAGTWTTPKAGDTVTLPDGATRAWKTLTPNKDGVFQDDALNSGYASISVPLETAKTFVLEAAPYGMVYVNGEPRVGDPYGYGYARLPIQLKAGKNELLFQCLRGQLRVRLVAPKSDALLNVGDATLPDFVVGEREATFGAVIVVNTTAETIKNLTLRALRPDGRGATTTLPNLPPLSTRKVGFRLDRPSANTPGNMKFTLDLWQRKDGKNRKLDTAQIDLRLRRPTETHKRTFVSEIDGSVQYYAVNPASQNPTPDTRHPTPAPALVLSLHGASVEAIGQADAYSPKSWAHLVAPTNRRPYGFDWEDWGRLDAMEVLDLAQQRLRTDPERVYLTGHSMGGHGTWHVGVTFPDRFAAIGPSAGWVSFWSYAGARRPENPDALENILQRATTPSDTLALDSNIAPLGVYILHGSADKNVPVGQAKTMNTELAKFHKDFTYFEQPGADHWWDSSDEPGADCVDWQPLFDLFARRRIPANAQVREVDFTTGDPGVSSRYRWASIEAQQKSLHLSRIKLWCDPGQRRFRGTTENVLRLALNVSFLSLPSNAAPKEKNGEKKVLDALRVELDGQKIGNIPFPETGKLWLSRDGGQWRVTSAPSPSVKNPNRGGPFKAAFRNRMLFVYGTRGSAAENAWAYAKARYDSETFWYRGNGAVEFIADTEFDPKASRERNVILYGNAETNAAWNTLLADSPVQVRRGSVRVGEKEIKGETLACLFVRPRPDSEKASVGVVSGSGLAGMRLTDRVPYFVSGVAFPDCTVLGTETLTQGARGIRCAGFFGPDWSVGKGEFAWREGP